MEAETDEVMRSQIIYLCKRGHKMKWLNYIILIAVVNLLGCTSIYVSSLTDPNYQLTKQSKIAIWPAEEETIELKKFVTLLTEEMRREGFNLVDSQEADYILFANLDKKHGSSSGTLAMPTTTYHSGYSFDGTYYSGTSSGTNYIPYTESYIVKKVYLTLYDLNKYRESEKMVIVWEGYIGSIDDECKNMKNCLYTLLQFFGTDFEDNTYVQSDKTRVK
jgi:hypothetical protein